MPTQWITYQNKKIVYADYSNLRGDDMLPVLYKLEEIAKSSNEKILILLNLYLLNNPGDDPREDLASLTLAILAKMSKMARLCWIS